MTKEQLLLQYKKAMKSFCKEYRSFYIPASQNVEELQENNQNKGISMINVFTPLSVVPLNEKRKGKDESSLQKMNLDEMMRDIDRKIYALDLDEIKAKGIEAVTETTRVIFLERIRKAEKKEIPAYMKEEFSVFEYREGLLDPEIHDMYVKAANSVLADYKESGCYILKGADIRCGNFEYFLLEPKEWKKEDTDIVEEISRKRKIYKPGKIILSSPGGGKTTQLQMIAYAYLDHCMLPKLKSDEAETYKQMRKTLQLADGYFPVFIRIRDLAEEVLSKTDIYPEFDKIILWALKSFVEIEEDGEKWEEILEEIKTMTKMALLIDGFDELDRSRQEQFMDKLKTFLEDNKKDMVYLSARYANYQDNDMKQMLEPYYIEEYVIEGLSNNYALIENFARNWYKCVFEHDKKKQRNVENAFLRPIKNDPNLQKLITNPLELTNLLIISSGEGYLPTDRNQIYEGAIELQLKWNHSRNLDPVDVEFQLAYLAYQMSESMSERILIGEEQLIDIICEARQELKRYFRTPQPLDREEIKEFIHYLVGNTCILQKNSIGGGNEAQYEFHHLQYQAFLTAFCITKGLFSKKKRRPSKFDYVKEYLDKMDDFWSQIIVLAAMQDIHLRDDIIENLVEMSLENKQQNQSVSMLLQLMAVPGINFDSEEKQIVAALLADDETGRMNLLKSKKEEIQWMLLNNTVSENKDFIKEFLDRIEKKEGDKKDRYQDKVDSILFFVLWECEVEEAEIRQIMQCCFKNRINIDIMMQIKNSIVRGQENNKVIAVIEKMGRENLQAMDEKQQKVTDYFMLIATIHCLLETRKILDNKNTPYEVVRECLQSENPMYKAIGVNILFLLAWLQQIKRQDIFNAPKIVPKKILEEIRPVLLEGILKNDFMTRDFEAVFRDLVQNKMIDRSAARWYSEEIFYLECEKLFKLEEITGEEYPVDVLSVYPLSRRTLQFGATLEVPEKTAVNLKKTYESAKADIKIRLFKLMSILHIEDEVPLNTRFYELSLTTKFTQKAALDELRMQVGEYYLEENKWYDESCERTGFNVNIGRQYYLDGEYEKAKSEFFSAFPLASAKVGLAFLLRRMEITDVMFVGHSYSIDELLEDGLKEKDAFAIINNVLYKNSKKKLPQMEEVELAEAFTVLEYAKNLTDAVLWWKAMLRKGNPEGAMVILSIHDAVPGYICEEDVEMSKEVLTMHKDIDIDESEEIFDYTDSNGNQKTGQAIFCYTDTKTNEKYLLFRQDIHSEQISISVSKFRRDEKEIILLPIVTQRDIVMEQIIRDIAIYILT